MKRIISVIMALSVMQGMIPTVFAQGNESYNDTEPKKLPKNIITGTFALDGQNAAEVSTVRSGSELLHQVESHPENIADFWSVFGGTSIYAGLNSGKYLSIDNFKKNTTYVYQAKVKNSSEDKNVIPYYGIAHTNNKHGYSNAVASNSYKKDGMAVTSEDWMYFKDTITYPETWNETSTGYLGQALQQGLNVVKSPVGAKVSIELSLVDSEVKNSFEDKSLYLAEEAACDIILSTNANEELVRGNTLNVEARVVNQIGIAGTLNQNVEWRVVTKDRKNVVSSIKADILTDGSLELSCDENTENGTYAAVAISDTYDIVKGIEFDVVDEYTIKFTDFVKPEMPANLIKNSNVLNNNSGNAAVKNLKDSYQYTATEETQAGGWNIFMPSALMAKNSSGDSAAVNLEHFSKGKTYVYRAKVKNSSAADDAGNLPKAYYGIAVRNKSGWGYSDACFTSKEYGKEGMAVTSADWQDFKASITFPQDWNETVTATNYGQRIFAGIGKKTDLGASVTIDARPNESLYFAEEILYDISNEVIEGSTDLSAGKSVTLKSEITNQIGIEGSFDQSISWYIMSADGKKYAHGFKIVENTRGNEITLSVDENTPTGVYKVIAYSTKYNVSKSINIKVKTDGKYKVYVAPNGNDLSDGSLAAPLATLDGAKAFVRKKISEGILEYCKGIDVIFKAGEYNFENTVNFTEYDSGTVSSPITYIADGDVVFNGSIKLDLTKAQAVLANDKENRLNEKAIGKAIKLDISYLPFDFEKMIPKAKDGTILSDGEYPEIYLNGNRENLAQWPNGEGNFVTYEYVAGDKFKYAESNPDKWVNAKNWWIGGYPSADYNYRRLPGVSVDAENKVVTVSTNTDSGNIFSKGDTKSKRWKAYNLLEELDEPGEWYIDTESKILYYYPTKKLEESDTLEITYLSESMITMNKTEYVSFDGFVFTETRGGVFNTVDIKNIDIRNCTFSGISGNAFYNTGSTAAQTDKAYWQRQRNDGSYNCVIENNIFEYVGGYAIHIYGGNVDTLTPGENTIKNNFIYKCSDTARGYPAVYLRGCGNYFEHNNISNLPFHAINLSGNDHIIRYNEIYNVCRETEDCAAIYQGRNTVQRGSVVEYNYLHDLRPLYTFANERYINAAVYWDDLQSGMTVKNNIIKNAKLGIFNNGGVDNTVSQNTIIDTYMAMRIDVRGAAQNVNDTTGITGFGGYIENPEIYYTKYKNLQEIIKTDPISTGTTGKALGKFNVREDNLIVNSEKGVYIDETKSYLPSGCTIMSSCSDFVDPSKQDYRIKLNSNTYQKNENFINESFDIDLIGVQKSKINLYNSFEAVYPKGKLSYTDTLHFAWTESTGAVSYKLEIAKDKNFTDIIHTQMTDFNYAEVTGIPVSAEKYYWRATAINSSRNMNSEKQSTIGEFNLGNIEISNISLTKAQNDLKISAKITNEVYSDKNSVSLYAAEFTDGGKLVNVKKYDITFNQSVNNFDELITPNGQTDYICLFLWEGMTPLTENVIKNYIN